MTRREVLKQVSLAAAASLTDAQTSALPGTEALEWEGDLDIRNMAGAHQLMDRLIAESPHRRAAFWRRDFSSSAAYEKSVEPNRDRFRRIIGAVDRRVPSKFEISGSRVRWQVLEGVTGEGCIVEPAGPPIAGIVLLPDAGDAPELFMLLASTFAGCRVIIPELIDRSPSRAEHTQTNREWIYRQAFHMGRHVIGYEVQKVLAALDCLGGGLPVGIVGSGEGGLIALYAAALDTRIQAALIGDYFGPREGLWEEPVDRNVWGLLREFGDAELATLIAPRALIVNSPPSARVEFDRIGELLKPDFQKRDFSESFPEALGHFLAAMKLPSADGFAGPRAPAIPDRQVGQVKELQDHVQALVRASDRTRNEFFLYQAVPAFRDESWNTLPSFPPVAVPDLARYRDYFWNEVMGRLEEPMLPPNPRSRRILDFAHCTGYDVVLNVWKELFAWGVLLVPKDLRPQEKRPVVICVHGRGGVPLDTIQGDVRYYHDYARRLADQGYVVFAPHILFKNEAQYRALSRKANSIKATLFSIIAAQQQQILRWLNALPFVDGSRIGFYGLSFGGETALRIPAVLPGYALSICSADFNSWTRKVADASQPWSFLHSDEFETPTFNMGNTFDHAELAYLISPHPFMVERGREDRVGRDEWVAYEFAKVSHYYARLGLGDRVEIEYFEGGHTIHGEETFRFLANHLNWRPRG